MPASSSDTYNRDRFLFIVNPGAGNGAVDWRTEISTFFRDRPYEVELYELADPPDPESLKKKISSSNANRVIAVGGDGTVKLIAGCLLGSSSRMGVLPAGSANGLAKELGIPQTPGDALKACLSPLTQKIHLLEINGQLSIHLSDIGFNAFTVKIFETQEGRGMWGYIKAAWKALWRHPHMQINIRSEGKQIKRKAAMVVIANATKYGSGAVINPLGRLDDDLFEIVIVKKISLSEIFKMMISHQPYDPEKTEVFQTSAIKIHSKRKAHFQVDGEYIGKINAVSASLIPPCLNIILPEEPRPE